MAPSLRGARAHRLPGDPLHPRLAAPLAGRAGRGPGHRVATGPAGTQTPRGVGGMSRPMARRIGTVISGALLLGAAAGVAVSGEQWPAPQQPLPDRKSTRLNSSHVAISYAVFCLKKKKKHTRHIS